jgi:hypothetical protein
MMSKYSKLERTPPLRVLLFPSHQFDDDVKGLAHSAESSRAAPSSLTRLPLLHVVIQRKSTHFANYFLLGISVALEDDRSLRRLTTIGCQPIA